MTIATPVAAPPHDSEPPSGRVSDRIRHRLVAAGQRFHANDNIADFIEEGELEAIQAEVVEHVQQMLKSLVIDTEDDHNSKETAKRVAKMYVREVFSGRYLKMPRVTEFPNAERLNELLIVGPITMRSACSHHLCPIIGKVWIGILPRPGSKLIGLSKYTRLCEWIMSRPQIQEEAVIQLADTLEERVMPEGLAIVIESSHFCMRWRGVKDAETIMTNSVMRGAFLVNADLRREFLSLLSRKNRC